jgi:hypothetical protein
MRDTQENCNYFSILTLSTHVDNYHILILIFHGLVEYIIHLIYIYIFLKRNQEVYMNKAKSNFEEMYRCLEKLSYRNYDVLLEYMHLRKKISLYAKAGFYLEQHRDDLYVDDTIFRELEKYKPTGKIYLEKGVNGSLLSKRWNLLVVKYVAERTWEEFNQKNMQLVEDIIRYLQRRRWKSDSLGKDFFTQNDISFTEISRRVRAFSLIVSS